MTGALSFTFPEISDCSCHGSKASFKQRALRNLNLRPGCSSCGCEERGQASTQTRRRPKHAHRPASRHLGYCLVNVLRDDAHVAPEPRRPLSLHARLGIKNTLDSMRYRRTHLLVLPVEPAPSIPPSSVLSCVGDQGLHAKAPACLREPAGDCRGDKSHDAPRPQSRRQTSPACARHLRHNMHEASFIQAGIGAGSHVRAVTTKGCHGKCARHLRQHRPCPRRQVLVDLAVSGR